MARTFVLAFTNSDAADTKMGELADDGFTIVKIAPTDQLEFKKDSDPSTVWRSGGQADFILVVATKDPVTGPVAPAG